MIKLNVDMPDRVKRLKVSARGYPIPFFVAYVDGVEDFRVIDPEKMIRCIKEKVCWVCGDKLGTHLTFPIGPQAAINRISGEPPAHRECARYSAQVCPFLLMPKMRRREDGLPETFLANDHIDPANPGITCLWTTKSVQLIKAGGGVLFQLGPPDSTEWFVEGRKATRDEVRDAVEIAEVKIVDRMPAEATESDRSRFAGFVRDRVSYLSVWMPQ